MMGIFTRHKKRSILSLTSRGQQKIVELAGSGPQFSVLMSIKDGNSTLIDISHDTGLDVDSVKEGARSLIKQGLVAVES